MIQKIHAELIESSCVRHKEMDLKDYSPTRWPKFYDYPSDEILRVETVLQACHNVFTLLVSWNLEMLIKMRPKPNSYEELLSYVFHSQL